LDYSHFLSTYTSNHWKKIGIKRRAGVAVPLFSLHSKKSTGIGEIPDIKLLIDWCKTTGLSIIQLLPLNEVGMDNSPYNAISTFALDPMYLRLENIKLIDKKRFKDDIIKLKSIFPSGKGHVDYKIKPAKVELLYDMFRSSELSRSYKYRRFKEKNSYWLNDYALYKFIKDHKDQRAWFAWKRPLRQRDEKTLKDISVKNKQRIEFYCWLQWQLHEQFEDVKKYAAENRVYLMGDIPFLVSRDSADVWAHQNYFKLDYEAGAPPDMFFAKGQRWGMPPYDWNNIAKDGFTYIKERLQYAESFYDMFRIDHFVGLLRVWIIKGNTPRKKGAKEGHFDPEQEYLWGEHGRKLLSIMIDSTKMLPCAEDLGTVPQASYSVLWKAGVPGIEIQRWTKDWNNGGAFIKPEHYRQNSISTVSTHDSSTLPVWWKYEAGTIETYLFKKFCRGKNLKITPAKLKEKLFDKYHPAKDKLYWKPEIDSVEKLISLVKLPPEECSEIINLYHSTYGEKEKFWKYIGLPGNMIPNPDTQFIRNALQTINNTASIFSIQLLDEWLYLNDKILNKHSSPNDRINFPGLISDKNWSIISPISLEALNKLSLNVIIREILKSSGRV
jgi:4-alpha-glucanotransferase